MWLSFKTFTIAFKRLPNDSLIPGWTAQSHEHSNLMSKKNTHTHSKQNDLHGNMHMTIFKDYTKCHDRKFTSMISTDLVDVYKRESYMHAINRCSCRRTESKAQVCETSLLDCCCITIITVFFLPLHLTATMQHLVDWFVPCRS